MTGAPSYARRRLGTALRRYRTEAGLSGEQAAESCGWDQSKISRIETAKVALSHHDLHRLCGLYSVKADEAGRLESLLSETRGSRWWAEYSDVLNSAYEELISLEAYASEVVSANGNLVVGLLQTRDYAAAVINSGAMVPDPDTADALVEVRLRRQAVLHGESPVTLNAVLSEGVLQCEIGGRSVLAAQLDHLLQLGDLPNVSIRVLPTSSSANAHIGGLTLFDFAGPHDPSVLFVEYHGGMLVKESARDIKRYRRHLSYLAENALSEDESRKRISTKLRTL